ncbi:SDR family oxidoreductase [Aspergillus vadensis CBS 113365]|uniref:Oxidoreductase n=1 Tax=Aspergillus vadensis (strain CBS 113365 / IMI 142717 / IBT 24658) TaxID=1448311 RepID=A0A319CBE3_ASPVC|nr:oxidoreductase [Aspergillus vadensis CBS 113365]PYH65852.1 oxidoreductase [Aspergillus vadensis CBS 113365]
MAPLKTVLITGCSANGIGSALAEALANQGHHVFATARSPSKIPSSLTTLSNVTPLQLDVTSSESVAAALQAVEQHGAGLDILINNAGSGYTMPLLDVDLAQAQQVYETNIWGPLRLTQAVAPLLLSRGGRVVNISSVGAVVPTPWIGIYSSSKSALSNLSETLRLELAPLGVSVATLMIGTVTTPFHANEPTFTIPPSSRYAAIAQTISRWASGEASPKGCSAQELVDLILPDVLGTTGNGMFWRGPNSGAVKFVSQWVPGWLADRMMSMGQGLDELAASQ